MRSFRIDERIGDSALIHARILSRDLRLLRRNWLRGFVVSQVSDRETGALTISVEADLKTGATCRVARFARQTIPIHIWVAARAFFPFADECAANWWRTSDNFSVMDK